MSNRSAPAESWDSKLHDSCRLVGAGLLLRSFVLLNRVEPGFNAENVLTARISLPFFAYRDWQKRGDFFQELQRRVTALPGVESVAGIVPLPLAEGDGQSWTGGYALVENDEDKWQQNEADYRPILPGFFETMETPLLLGRTFTEADNRLDAQTVIVVDDVLAARIWPERNPIGERLFIRVPNETNTGSVAAEAEVIGVVDHIRHRDVTRDGRGTIYAPYRRFSWFELSMVVRTTVDPLSVADAVRREVLAVDPNLPIYAFRTMEQQMAAALAPTRFALVLIAVFAVTALILAAVGLYGVISYLVRQRTREIGVRMALGARGADIVRLVVGQGLTLAAFGIVIGLVGAFALSRLVESMLFGVAPSDPLTYVGISGLLIVVATVACYLPARRTTRVDPMIALRHD